MTVDKIDMELAVAEWLGIRQNIVVPNVSWGLDMHECDMLSLTKAGYATEVEIKRTRHDLRRDSKKTHGHHDNRIRRLYFAFPYDMAYDEAEIPERAGIIKVGPATDHGMLCTVVRECKANINATKFSEAERLKLAHLGTMRIWSMKRKLKKALNK